MCQDEYIEILNPLTAGPACHLQLWIASASHLIINFQFIILVNKEGMR